MMSLEDFSNFPNVGMFITFQAFQLFFNLCREYQPLSSSKGCVDSAPKKIVQVRMGENALVEMPFTVTINTGVPW